MVGELEKIFKRSAKVTQEDKHYKQESGKENRQKGGQKDKQKNGVKTKKWLRVKWKPFGEESFLVVLKKEYYKEAREAHPGKVLYFLPELRQLARSCAGKVEVLKRVHAVKKILGGWVIPEMEG